MGSLRVRQIENKITRDHLAKSKQLRQQAICTFPLVVWKLAETMNALIKNDAILGLSPLTETQLVLDQLENEIAGVFEKMFGHSMIAGDATDED